MLSLPVLAVTCLGLPLSTSGARIIVDDADPAFSYSGDWNTTTPSSPCTQCSLQPDPARVYRGSWHDTLSNSTARLSFVGVSVEIYTINPPDFDSTSANTWSFNLDSEDDGYFMAPRRPNVGSYAYNYLAYARSNMTLGPHTVEITNRSPSLILLDYAVYDDGNTSTSQAVPSWPRAQRLLPPLQLLLLRVVPPLAVTAR